jgi:transcriptional regulator with XRE-family HTH domain
MDKPDTNLTRLRKQAGLSQGQLAIATDISKTRISDYETGQRDIGGVSLKVAVRLARALGVYAEDLLDEK